MIVKMKNFKPRNNNRSQEKLPFFRAGEMCRLDLIVAGLVLLFLFFTCAHGDIMLTGNRSFLMYRHFTDFYKASYEQSGGYYANYLPSTFIAYAIWNLPLYLTGHIPESVPSNVLLNTMWYKLLPVILYMATGYLIYKIGVLIGFGEKKAKMCGFAFIIFPIGVFSQFIFSQYDIFTVFFMVLGLYFYFRGGMFRYALFFGIAITFKYQALMYFGILLVLKEKKIRNMIKYGCCAVLPLAVEVLPNIRSEYFRRNVLGFGALEYVKDSVSFGFMDSVNPIVVVAAFMLVWAYQKKVYEQKELVSWALFFCMGISFSIFGFSVWNPQWLLLFVPFLVLSIFRSENGNLLLMVTNIFMVALYIFISKDLVNEGVLYGGIFNALTNSEPFPITMWEIYRFHNKEMLAACMWVVLLVYVVFNHPKYHTLRGPQIACGLMNQMRSAFAVGVLAFIVPAFICLSGFWQGKVVFADSGSGMVTLENISHINKEEPTIQYFKADGYEITDIRLRFGGLPSEALLHVAIRDQENQEVIYEGDVQGALLAKDEELNSVLTVPVKVEKGSIYSLELTSDVPEDEEIFVFCTEQEEGSDEPLVSGGEEGMKLRMKITGLR